MNKIFIVTLLMLLIVSACSIGPVSIYNFRPILEIEGDTSQIIFRVPDVDDDGWWNGYGETTEEFEIVIKETTGNDAYITDIEWSIVGNDNEESVDGEIMLENPFTLNNSDTTYTVNITLTENNAHDFDGSDGDYDEEAEGVIIFKFKYYDERAEFYNSIPVYIPIKVVCP